MKKVWDVVPPKDVWQYQYAHLEYLRVGLFRIMAKTIQVQDV